MSVALVELGTELRRSQYALCRFDERLEATRSAPHELHNLTAEHTDYRIYE